MYHDIEREPVSFFLREACQKKLSGHLFVNARDYQITLNFLDGKLANGMSTRFGERLIVILREMGNISEEQYNLLNGMQQLSDDQVAGFLLDRKFAKKKDIYYARIFQLRRIAISTFALQRGVWIFTAGEPDPPLREVFEIPLEAILTEGARAVDHVSVYANLWRSAVPLLFNEIPMASEIYFTDDEREFFAALQGLERMKCRELIARLDMAPLEFWRGMLAFHLLGIIDFEQGGEEEGEREEEEKEPDVSAEIAAMLDLYQKLQQAEPGDAGPLGLPAPLTAATVQRVTAELLVRFAPERFGPAAAPEIRQIAGEVCRRLRTLAAWPEAGPELPGEAEWRRSAVEEEESDAEFELTPEFAIDAEPAPETGIIVDIPLSGQGNELETLGDEPEAFADTPVPVPRIVMDEPLPAAEIIYEAEEAQEAPAAPVTSEVEWVVEPAIAGASDAEPEPPPLPAVEPLPLRMANPDHEKAWDLLLKSKELYEKHEYAAAVPLLKKAIKLEPRQGDFYYLLGLCQSEAELTKNEAEINLKKAIELKSWSADPVYALGVLYRHQGRMNLAERCFQRVKEIAYEHTGASRALVDLRRRKSTEKPPGTKKKRF